MKICHLFFSKFTGVVYEQFPCTIGMHETNTENSKTRGNIQQLVRICRKTDMQTTPPHPEFSHQQLISSQAILYILWRIFIRDRLPMGTKKYWYRYWYASTGKAYLYSCWFAVMDTNLQSLPACLPACENKYSSTCYLLMSYSDTKALYL